MFPIIVSSLLNTETKSAKIALPFKLLAILFLVVILFSIQVSQKIFKIGERDSREEPTPLVKISIPSAEAQSPENCWLCLIPTCETCYGSGLCFTGLCGGPCGSCYPCGEYCFVSCAEICLCQSCTCSCTSPNQAPSVDNITQE